MPLPGMAALPFQPLFPADPNTAKAPASSPFLSLFQESSAKPRPGQMPGKELPKTNESPLPSFAVQMPAPVPSPLMRKLSLNLAHYNVDTQPRPSGNFENNEPKAEAPRKGTPQVHFQPAPRESKATSHHEHQPLIVGSAANLPLPFMQAPVSPEPMRMTMASRVPIPEPVVPPITVQQLSGKIDITPNAKQAALFHLAFALHLQPQSEDTRPSGPTEHENVAPERPASLEITQPVAAPRIVKASSEPTMPVSHTAPVTPSHESGDNSAATSSHDHPG
ncbi:MAG TPA: hypothetical protein VHA14_20890, partial [Bryobacteraceae bacterium]|nr:hypothetical protein [Bryobacteraceae bacterium]